MLRPAHATPAHGRPLLRIGFLALTDAAPLAVAQENGIFARYGLEVRLSREVGWATIREKIIRGDLDAAPAPAPMLWAVELGLGCTPAAVCTALVLNLHGNALTLSSRLRMAGVHDAATLRAEVRSRRRAHRLTFGIVFPYSSHHLLLRHWLLSAGINPERDVHIAVVPPAQTLPNLVAGTLDGYCAGEPWGSLAVQAGVGWCPVWSSNLWPGHMEKILLVRTDFAQQHARTHTALVSALAEACAWCDEPANRPALAPLLARREWLHQPAHAILPSLVGQFDGGGGRIESVPDFHVFARGGANEPSYARAEAMQAELVAAGLLPKPLVTPGLPHRLFRPDLFHAALQSTDLHAPAH